MGTYVQHNLIDNEVVKYEGKQSLKARALEIIAGIIFLLCGLTAPMFLIFAFIVLIKVYLAYTTTEMAITNKRVVAKAGFIRRRTIEINIGKIESLQVKQGVLGRMLDYGSIIVSGAGTPQAPISGISNPLAFKRRFFEIQDNL